MEKDLSGSIVNIGSIVSQRGNKGQCNYAASKAAVEIFSKTVALEMARFVVRPSETISLCFYLNKLYCLVLLLDTTLDVIPCCPVSRPLR